MAKKCFRIREKNKNFFLFFVDFVYAPTPGARYDIQNLRKYQRETSPSKLVRVVQPTNLISVAILAENRRGRKSVYIPHVYIPPRYTGNFDINLHSYEHRLGS